MRRIVLVSFVVSSLISSRPAAAEQPIHNAAAREAARIAREQTNTRERTLTRPGFIIAAAGTVVAVLGGTAFRTEKTTSGNTPPSGFESCEALKANPVYAGNRCDDLKGPNLAIVGAGIAIAGAGVTLMAIKSSHADVQVGAAGVRFTGRVRF
jgi:hypothetical protein